MVLNFDDHLADDRNGSVCFYRLKPMLWPGFSADYHWFLSVPASLRPVKSAVKFTHYLQRFEKINE